MKKSFFEDFIIKFKKTSQSKSISLLLCVVCGLFSAIPYFFEKLYIFTFVSLILQFYVAIQQKKIYNKCFLPFFAYFLGFYTPLYFFLSELYPYERFGFDKSEAFFIVICSCILIPLLHTAVESSILSLSKYFKTTTEHIIGFAALWCIGEWILTLGTLAFPWGNISVSLTGCLPYLQTASVFGKYFVTFVTVGGCSAIAFGFFDRKRFTALLGVLAILFNLIIGTFLWYTPSSTKESISAAAIQGNISSNEKWKKENSSDILERHLDMISEAASNGAKVVILAESAIPLTFRANGTVHKSIAELTQRYQITVITGAHYRDKENNEYNSAIAILPDGSLSSRYDKQHLVPFGEFIPFVDILGSFFPFLAAFNESSSIFVEGNESIVISADGNIYGPMVCFDSIFPQFASQSIANGAEMLTVVTNDSWFYDSIGIYTHLRHSQIRAIENNRYVLRAANTGISAFIDNKGKISDATEPLVFDILYSNVYAINEKSLYFYIGDFILYISFFIIAIIYFKNKRRSKNGKDPASQERDI